METASIAKIRRQRAVNYAIGNVELEGGSFSEESLLLFEQYVDGLLTMEQLEKEIMKAAKTT